jgi:ubiquinone/menaquinone biosynthesis C-methylase UbiE
MDYKSESESFYNSGRWLSDEVNDKPYLTLGACGHIAVFAMKHFLGNISGQKVIDIGGGDGTILYYLEGRKADTAFVCDIALTPLKRCRFNAVEGDAINLPVKTGSVDVALSSDILEHLDLADVETAFKEMARILKRNSRIIIHTSCFGFYTRRIGSYFTGRGRLDRCDIKDGHKNRMTRDEIIRIAKRYGLILEKEVFYKHLFQPFVRRIRDFVLKKDDGRYSSDSINNNLFLRIIKFIITLISFYDIILFGSIPGGSIILRFRKI